ncbi:hypothetical protein J6590_076129 [Homalodisca vitripennis]|nr:hypothetical protein J6590_076129 [Homalodisca vitripennis]
MWLGGGKQRPYLSSRLATPSSSTVRTAEIILVLVLLFMVSWTPYAVVTAIGQFGDPSWVTPWVAALPAIFAKLYLLKEIEQEEVIHYLNRVSKTAIHGLECGHRPNSTIVTRTAFWAISIKH